MPDPPETTRKHHVWRQRQNEDSEDIWLDILRTDQFEAYKRIGEDYQKVIYKLQWDDESLPEEHPTRKVEKVEAANPEDATQVIDVYATSKLVTYHNDQKIIHKFLGGEVETQTAEYRRVYHMDVVQPDDDEEAFPCQLEDYERDEETLDEEQYIDVKVVHTLVTTTGEGQSFQRQIFRFNTDFINQFSEPIAEDELDLDKIVHLDPLQNIINVQWATNMFVAGVGGFVQALHHSLDGDEFTLDTTAVVTSGNVIVNGNGKWFVAGGGGGKLYESEDGIEWTDIGNHPLSTAVYSGCFGNDIFVLGGLRDMAWSDDDGVTWNVIPIPGVSEDDNYIVSSLNFIKADPDNPATVDRFFAGLCTVSRDTTFPLLVMTSTDGISWSSPQTVFSDPDFNRLLAVNGVVYGNEKYVVAGGVVYRPDILETPRTYVSVSTNGTSWGAPIYTEVAHSRESPLGPANQFGDHIVFGNGSFVVVGGSHDPMTDSYVTKGRIAASSNGTSWTTVFDGDPYHIFGCVEFGGGKFLAGGLRGGDAANLTPARASIMQSEDGTTWTYSEIQPNPGQTDFSTVVCIRKGSR